jgi:hypothetical protein
MKMHSKVCKVLQAQDGNQREKLDTVTQHRLLMI